MRKILYTETSAYAPSSAHFLEALQAKAARGECEMVFLDEAQYLGARFSKTSSLMQRVIGRPAGFRALNAALLATAQRLNPDVVLIGKGAYFDPAGLWRVRTLTGATMVNWAPDDPFNPLNSTRDLIASIPVYDLCVCTKSAVIPDLARAGAASTLYVRFGYKPATHFLERPSTPAEHHRFDCDVMFIGGCDADRVPYFEALRRALPDIRLNLYGAYWDQYPSLADAARGPAVGREFRLAAAGAKISINLVRRANRDDHVMRTFELPACGAFVITERTPAHVALFVEDREAVFFSSPEEMVNKVREWLSRDSERQSVAAAGRERIVDNRHTYADRVEEILAAVRGLDKRTSR